MPEEVDVWWKGELEEAESLMPPAAGDYQYVVTKLRFTRPPKGYNAAWVEFEGVDPRCLGDRKSWMVAIPDTTYGDLLQTGVVSKVMSDRYYALMTAVGVGRESGGLLARIRATIGAQVTLNLDDEGEVRRIRKGVEASVPVTVTF